MSQLASNVARAAGQQLRSRTRDLAYFQRGDRFAERLLGRALVVDPDHLRTAAVDIAAALDTCYDEASVDASLDAARLPALTQALEDALDAQRSAASLPDHLEALARPGCTLQELSSALLAATTTLGYQAISVTADADVASLWHCLWSEQIRQHDAQQEHQVAMIALRAVRSAERRHGAQRDCVPQRVLPAQCMGVTEKDLRPKARSFSAGVLEYVAAFANTSAASIALLGAVPFSQRLRGAELRSVLEMCQSDARWLSFSNRTLRFALDVRFDPSEPWSAGVHAIAAERGVSILDIEPRELSAAEVGARLRREWLRYLRESPSFWTSSPQDGLIVDAAREVLAEIMSATRSVAEALGS